MEDDGSSVEACDQNDQADMRCTSEDNQKSYINVDDIVMPCHTNRADSEDEKSQSGNSNRTAWSFPQYEGEQHVKANGMALLGRLRSEMPSVAEKCETPAEMFVQYARNCKHDAEKLGCILDCLQKEDEDFVSTMRGLWSEFRGDSLCACCAVLERYTREDLKHADEVILLLLQILSEMTNNDVRVACLDVILHICRALEEVLSISGSRVAKPRLSDLVRDRMVNVLAPFTKEGGNEELAIRILARSAQLDQVLDIIGACGWLIEKVLAEIFYTLENVISFATDEDCAEIERAWARTMLCAVSKQCRVVDDIRCQMAWVRTGRQTDYKTRQCVLIGLLFSPAMLINMFDLAVKAIDEDVITIVSYAVMAIIDMGASIATLQQQEYDLLTEHILKLDQRNLQRYCRTALISMPGSIINHLRADRREQMLQLIVHYAGQFMSDRGTSVDYAVVWSLAKFVQASLGCNDWKDKIDAVCTSYVKKYRDYTWGEGERVLVLAGKILDGEELDA